MKTVHASSVLCLLDFSQMVLKLVQMSLLLYCNMFYVLLFQMVLKGVNVTKYELILRWS